jgi:peptide/nickel transport system substrate-binding protein
MARSKKTLLIFSVITVLTLTILPIKVAVSQDETLFSVTIIAPGNANMMRRQWGQIIANSLIQLGIDARVVYLDWTSVYDRVMTPPEENVGKTYDDGGYDIQLIGWTPGLIPNPAQIYYGSPEAFAPIGNNYYLYNRTHSNDLMDTYLTTTNLTERDQAAQELQAFLFDDLPASIIFYASNPTAVNPDMGGRAFAPSPGGEGWLYFNAQPNPEMLTYDQTSVVYASTGEIESLIPILSNSWYDTIIYSNIHSGLVMVHPDLSNLAVPNLLTSWTPYNNGFNWNYTCRTGVTWHDGEPFTADDVVFSYWAALEPTTGTQHAGTYTMALGDKTTFTFSNGTSLVVGDGTREGNVTAWDDEHITLSLPEMIPGKPYGFIDPYLLGLANNIIPKHIFEQMDPADWTDSPFNTGEGSIDIGGKTYTGPVGTGPYKWVDFDPVAQLVHLQKFDQYWNKTALEADGLFDVTDYYIRFIADKTPALAALKNEEVDMLDPNYMIQADVPTIDPAWGWVLLHEGTGIQEIGFNQQHLILGTGVDTPLGQSDPSRAAEAARYVRIAIDYAIPRQLIIDNLLTGYGSPGAVHWLPTNPYYNASVTARPYDLALAKEYLEKAGYGVPSPPPMPTFPSFLLGMSTQFTGTYTDPTTGNVAANRELKLMATTNNATYDTTSTPVDITTTDLTGFYSLTATPPSTGVYYYYLFDRLAAVGTEWQYLTMLNVTSIDDALSPLHDLITDNFNEIQELSGDLDVLADDLDSLKASVNTMTYIAVAALIIAIALGLVAIFMARKSS